MLFQQFTEAAQLYEVGLFYDRAAAVCLKANACAKVGELLEKVKSPKIHIQYGKIMEKEKKYKIAVQVSSLHGYALRFHDFSVTRKDETMITKSDYYLTH